MPLFAFLAACGADLEEEPAPGPAPTAEWCDVEGPTLLLPLTNEPPPDGIHSVLAVGDRLLFVVRIDDTHPPGGSVHSVGPCGEEPVIVGADVNIALTSPHFPDAAFGCRWNTNQLVRLDPTGAKPPEDVYAAQCPANFTKHGLVAYDPTLGSSFYPTLDAAAASFGEPIALPEHATSLHGTSLIVLEDEILLIDGNSDLIRVSLPDLGTSVELEDVDSVKVSADGRYMLTQGFIYGEEELQDIYLHDRQEGRSTMVGRGGALDTNGSRFVSEDYALVQSVGDFQNIVALPALAYYPIPRQFSLRDPVPDGRWLAILDGAWVIFDPLDEQDGGTLITEREGFAMTRTNEYVDLRTDDPDATGETLPLVRFFYDTAKEPVQLAPRVHKYAFALDDGRIVTPVEVDESGLGGLVLVDPKDQKEQVLDEQVVVGDGRVARHPGHPDVLVYAVVDGERTGVWATRLAPQE